MHLDKKAVTLGAAAVTAAIVLGALAGAITGVLTALAGLVSAMLWQWASARQAMARVSLSRVQVAAHDLAPPFAEASSPAGYLQAEAAVVSFWPRRELDLLRGWLVSDRPADVALVTGQAGAGNTRMALQLAAPGRRPAKQPSARTRLLRLSPSALTTYATPACRPG